MAQRQPIFLHYVVPLTFFYVLIICTPIVTPFALRQDCSMMLELLEVLRGSGFITDDLALPKQHEPGHSQSYMGVCRLPAGEGEGRRYRRVDIKLYPT